MRPRNKVLIALLGLLLSGVLGVPLLLAALGARIPREHVASVQLELDAPPADVYAKIRAVEQAPSWRTGVSRVQLLPDDAQGRPRFREYGDNELTFTIDEEIPDRRLVTRISEPGPFGGRWVYTLQPQGQGTRLTITEEGAIDNPILRFLAKHALGYDATLRAYRDDLSRALER